MTLTEFQAKWKDISVQHAAACEKRGGFDYALCTCGHDARWAARNADLRTVPEEEIKVFQRDHAGRT
jgi:hypothetical protein